MGRRALGAVVVAAQAAFLLVACGERPLEPERRERGLTGAVLVQRDLPPDFLPASNQPVFWGVNPANPNCARLLGLADLSRVGPAAPQTHASFYRPEPAASLVEHVVRLPPGAAADYVAQARGAGAICSSLQVGVGDRLMYLIRNRMTPPPGARTAYAASFQSRPGDRAVRFDVVLAEVDDHLLVLGHPGMADPRWGDTVTEDLAAHAVRRLRAARADAAGRGFLAPP